MSQNPLPCYEVYALRYATLQQRHRRDNFIADPHDGPMPMDYFVWLIRGDGRTVLVDTGFNAKAAAARGRTLLRCPIEALSALDVKPSQIEDVIVTHMHYDHAGNLDLLPHARIHIQEAELQYTVSRHMTFKPLRHPFCVHDVAHTVHRLFRDDIRFHIGDSQFAPGIELLLIGGHTLGLQSVRVHTARGWVVLASDASHYYENIGTEAPFPLVHDVSAMLAGHRRLLTLADSTRHLVPGHDPLVRMIYPQVGTGEPEIVQLHRPPTMDPLENFASSRSH